MENVSNSQDVSRGGEAHTWDDLLAKYVRVWVWSAILGANAGLTYLYIGVEFQKPWGALTPLLLALMALGVVASFASWWALLVHLRIAIVPSFFGYQSPHDSQEYTIRQRRAARTIIQSYQYFTIAALVRLLFSLVQVALQVIR